MTQGLVPAFRSYDGPFSYAGPTGHEGRCWLQVYERRGAPARRPGLGGKIQPRRERHERRRAGRHPGVAAASPAGQGGHCLHRGLCRPALHASNAGRTLRGGHVRPRPRPGRRRLARAALAAQGAGRGRGADRRAGGRARREQLLARPGQTPARHDKMKKQGRREMI